MYQNRNNLKLGQDYYYLDSGKYAFTYIFDGDDRIEIEGYDIPLTVKPSWSNNEYESWAYNKLEGKALDEDDMSEICYSNVLVTKERLDALATSKAKIQAIIDEANIKEPFVFEGGKLSVGKEHVLSAHIQAGYDQGWISSSICW